MLDTPGHLSSATLTLNRSKLETLAILGRHEKSPNEKSPTYCLKILKLFITLDLT